MDLTVSTRYSGERGERYAAAHHAPLDSPSWDVEFAFFRPYLRADDTVLDFGCANGGLLRRTAAAVSVAHGLEVNPASRAVAEAAGLTVFARLGDIPPGQRYDRIVTNHVLEHLRDVCGALEALRGLLRARGRLVAKLPIDDFRAAHQRRWSRDDGDWHLQTWTPRLFANVLHESGFEVVECRVVTSAWHGRLLPFRRVGLGRFACWALAALRRRRQLFAVAGAPP